MQNRRTSVRAVLTVAHVVSCYGKVAEATTRSNSSRERTQLVGGGIREELTRLFGVKIRVGRSTRGCPDLRL